MNKIAIALHGGAGTILPSELTLEKELAYKNALKTALNIGYQILENGGTALDAVEKTVISLEDCPLFNAAKGSVFNSIGSHEMDASIMDGSNKDAGAVCGVSGIKNPISLARLVMEKTEHVLFTGEGAMAFAKSMGLPILDAKYFFDEYRYQQWQQIKDTNKTQLDHIVKQEQKFGTVGAVAVDVFGNIAAATSTGGMTNKKYGRVGDTPIIGAGTYAANATCAVSCTGSGEFFIKSVVAYDVSALMEFKGLSLADACAEAVQVRLKSIGGDGGLIAIDAKGNICMEFNTEGMYRACKDNNDKEEVLIYK